MTINIFEGARRVGILIAGLVTVGTIALVIIEAPSVSATFVVDGPGTLPKRAVADYECSDRSASESQTLRTQKGIKVYATFCFPPRRVTHNDVLDLSTAVRNDEKSGRTPNTLQYGEQVTGRVQPRWMSDPIVEDYSQVSDSDLTAAISKEPPDASSKGWRAGADKNPFDQFDKKGPWEDYATTEWLIPIRPGPKSGQWWGGKKDTPEVIEYTERVAKSFRLSAQDDVWVKDQYRRERLDQFIEAGKWLVVGLLVFWMATFVIGWIVRGFLGIPSGFDRKPTG